MARSSGLLGVYEAGATTKSARLFLGAVRHLRSALAEAEAQGRPSTFIQAAKHEGRAAILADVAAARAAERAELEEQLARERDRFKKQFDKEADKHHYNLNRAAIEFEGMSDAELVAVAREMPSNIDRHIALRAALRQRGLIDAFDILAAEAKRQHITEPWKGTPVGQAVAAQLALTAPVSGGGVLIDGGNGGRIGVSFEGAWDAFEEADNAESE